jgi:hypothetical protein
MLNFFLQNACEKYRTFVRGKNASFSVALKVGVKPPLESNLHPDFTAQGFPDCSAAI